jgi:hypothetical protein
MFAVDLDGGLDALWLLHERGIHLPSTPTSKTANGLHVFLSAPGAVPDRVGLLTTNGGKPQVDIRGVGIVVAPPSIHPSGVAYAWEIPLALPLPPAPQSLLDLIQTGRVREKPNQTGSSWVIESLRGVPEGQRDDTCTRLAGFLLGVGLDSSTTEALLVESFAKNCTPPLDPATVRKCVRSIHRKEAVSGSQDRTIEPEHISTVLKRWQQAVDEGPPKVVPTPYPLLNSYLGGGFGQGELIYLGARPSVGKTALGLEIARHAASGGTGVLVISREMLNVALGRRIIAQDSKIPALALKTGLLSAEEWRTYAASHERLRSYPLWMTDQVVSLDETVAIMAAFHPSPPIGLLIVDYLQLIRAPKDIRECWFQVEAVSQALKTLAVQYQIPVLCLSSLSRPPGDAKEKRPTLSSLRESGELEHDADIVLLLHREPLAQETECAVAKNRDGRQGKVLLTFRKECVSFEAAKNQEGES